MKDDLRLHGLIGGAASEKNFLLKYAGVSDVITDLKGNPIQVAVGDYVYNEFNSTKLDGPTTPVDRSTPTQVINANYETSGNGGRKLTRLSNGWLISAVYDSAGVFRFYKSENNGATWSQICFFTSGALTSPSWAIASHGTTVYFIITHSTAAGISLRRFDALTQSNVDLPSTGFLENGQTAIGACSLDVDSNGNIHAAWSSKNSTFPNSFNIRYTKIAPGGATWETPTQITSANSAGIDSTQPCIAVMGNGHPIIVFMYDQPTSTSRIQTNYYNGSAWLTANNGAPSATSIHNGGANLQFGPTVTVGANGDIHVAWHGTDATDTTANNIRYSRSTNNGVSWSAMEKLTSGNLYTQFRPSIACDANNVVHITWSGITATSSNFYNVRMIKGTSGNWGAIEQVTNQNAVNVWNTSVCNNYRNFEKPLMVWKNGSVDIKFYGKWNEALSQIIPPMSLATSKTQLQAIYADTLKMVNLTTDARYQGFVSKKDLWTTALQELDWVAANVLGGKNLFGLSGAAKRQASGSFTSITRYLNVSGLSFRPSHIIVRFTRDTTTQRYNLSYSEMTPTNPNNTAGTIDDSNNRGFSTAVWTINADGFNLDFTNLVATGQWIAFE